MVSTIDEDQNYGKLVENPTESLAQPVIRYGCRCFRKNGIRQCGIKRGK
jgi:hypothetical protein